MKLLEPEIFKALGYIKCNQNNGLQNAWQVHKNIADKENIL